MGGCVKLKTVTEIRQSSDCDTFIAEGVYFCTEFFVGLEASGEIETEVLCDQFCFFFFQYEASSTVLYYYNKNKL